MLTVGDVRKAIAGQRDDKEVNVYIRTLHDGISDTPLSQAKHTLTRGERRGLLCSVHAAQVRNGERKLDG